MRDDGPRAFVRARVAFLVVDVECQAGVRPARIRGPWGALKHLNRNQDPAHGPHAVALVRRFGGVLEHPAASGLFAHCGMPAPSELPDAFGGVTIEVQQCDWGHVARKRTWLYIVGVRDIPEVPPRREPTHWVSGGRVPRLGGGGGVVPPGIKICSAQQRRRTPQAFAVWLLEIALAAQAPGQAKK